MSEQEPVTLCELWMLGMETLDQSHEGTSTSVRSKHRLGEPAAEWIFWVVFNGSCEETTVQVKDAYGKVNRLTHSTPDSKAY